MLALPDTICGPPPVRQMWLRLIAVSAVAIALALFYFSPIMALAEMKRASVSAGADALAALGRRIALNSINATIADKSQRSAAEPITHFDIQDLLRHSLLSKQVADKVRADPVAARAAMKPVLNDGTNTRLTFARYMSPNRFKAILWDRGMEWETVLVFQRPWVLGRWRVVELMRFRRCGVCD